MRPQVRIGATARAVALACAFAALTAAGCGVEYTNINDAVVVSANVERRLEKINEKYKLGATDQILVIVRDQTSQSTQHAIRPDGNVTLELVGDIYVEGLTPMQAADDIAKALQVYVREVDVTVRVTGFNSKRFYMFGETQGVGAWPFDGDVTVLDAFGRARGVTQRAAWDRIRLVRATPNTRQVFKINLADIVKSGDWQTNLQLKTNDVLYIPPTYLARVGYFVDNLLFPFRPVFNAMNMFQSFGGNENN